MERPLYQALATKIQAILNCQESGNMEWEQRHAESVDSLTKQHMPSGGGFDSGTQFDDVASKPERLVFTTSFHHMNDVGSYDGWTDHSVIVTPSLANGFNLRITGRNRNDIKDYIHESFDVALRTIVSE